MKSQLIAIIKELGKRIKRIASMFHRILVSLNFSTKAYKSIPIIIVNFNRFEYLKTMIKSLEKKGYTNIIILDNASTYPPLMAYYDDCPYEIIRLKENFGHKALFYSGEIYRFNHTYFVYSDPDLELLDECPDDFLLQMLRQLKKYPKIDKVALSLKIDDLPDRYDNKDKVIAWESRFFKKEYRGMYIADVDTTFALYQPDAIIGYDDDDFACRMPYPIQCRHLPWYEDSNVVSDEDKYYLAHKRTDVSWWMQPSDKVGQCPICNNER